MEVVNMSFRLDIWADGASSPHNKKAPGGWAYAYVINNMLISTNSGATAPTTNQRMELNAVIQALKNIDITNKLDKFRPFEEINIHSDSAYVINGMIKQWYLFWRYNGWKTADQNEVKNKDLWEELSTLAEHYTIYRNEPIKINWIHVKGHNGILFNEVVDKLAVKAKKSIS